MSEVTQILNAIDAGEPQAATQLLPLVYDELRKLAAQKMSQEKPGQTLDATGLVHEAYLRLVGGQHFENRRHFFGAAAEAMRRILIDQARRKLSAKGGGRQTRCDLDPDQVANGPNQDPLETLAIHEALEALARKSPRMAELVTLRYFLGCTMTETAVVLGIAPATAEEDWTYAKAWLRRQLRRGIDATSFAEK